MEKENVKQTVLITGASSGIGFELSRVFAANGYNLVISARSTDKLESIAKDLKTRHAVTVETITADLSIDGSAEKLFNACPKIDVLVNNAGVGQFGDFLEIDSVHENSMMKLNMRAPVVLSRLFGREMAKRKSGRIMNIASSAGFMPFPTMAVYAATKAFILSFSEALSAELAAFGVTVTAVCPGPVATGFEKSAGLDASGLFKIMKPVRASYVAESSFKACLAGKRVFIPGFLNKLTVFATLFTPRTLLMKSLMRMAR
jgi:short-subunit dehydrogenase